MRSTGTDKGNRWHKGVALILCVVLLGALCACDMFASLDLTEEQSGLIAEYAAGLLKKYDKNGARLMNPDAIKEPEEEKPQEVAPTPEPEEAPPEEPQVNMKEVQQFEARVAAAHARLNLLTAKKPKKQQKGKKQ